MIRLMATAVALLIYPTVAEAAVQVVATIPDAASLVETIGGDRVRAVSIVKGRQDPHYVEPKPSYMRLMNQADLLVYVGLQLEIGWLPPLIRGARNPRIAPGGPGTINLSEGIDVLEIPHGEVDRAQGDIHPEGNPHYWLNPNNGLVMASNIASRLTLVDPDNAEFYRINLDRFSGELKSRIADWERRLDRYKGTDVITYHKQWEYLTEWLGMRIVNQIEDRPGIPPAPLHLAELIRQLETGRISFIISSEYINLSTARNLEKRTGIPLVTLPASVSCCPEITDYIGLFERIASILESIKEKS
jgi:zinc/manganese transport system substrate-binding protein